MEKNLDQPAVIQFCVKLSYNTTKKYENMRKAFGESVVSRATIFQWHRLFISSKKSVKDKEKRGKPATTKMFKNIAWVEQIL